MDEPSKTSEINKDEARNQIPKTYNEKTEPQKTSSVLLAKTILDAIEFRPSFFGFSINFKALGETIKGKGEEYRKSLEERKILIVKQLLESDIDPQIFDVLIQNEVDRRLKIRFGVAFLVLTFLFTTASYAIVILDGIYKWNIFQVAITALIIETPLQFIGLLYIIARNLFPQSDIESGKTKISRKTTELSASL